MMNQKRSPIVSLVTVLTLMFSMGLGIIFTERTNAQSINREPGDNKTSTATKTPALNRYAQNLTKLAQRGAFDAVVEHESAVVPTIKILARSKQNNPVLIAEDASDPKAVVQILARRIATGAVPESMLQTRLYSLNVAALLDGVKTSAELETRVKALLSEMLSVDGNSILFVEGLHQFVGPHATQTVSAMMTEAAVAGKVRLLGSTSSAAYEQYIAGNATLDGLFKEVNLAADLGSTEANDEDSEYVAQSTAEGFQGEKISEDLR